MLPFFVFVDVSAAKTLHSQTAETSSTAGIFQKNE